MGKVFGFSGDYSGLDDNEAWTRVYDFGKNLMPIRNSKIQKDPNFLESEVFLCFTIAPEAKRSPQVPPRLFYKVLPATVACIFLLSRPSLGRVSWA